MKLGWGRTIFSYVVAAASAYALCVGSACAQVGSGEKPQMAEDVFKNVQVLKGISVDEFMATMGFFAASLSLNCTDCHISESSGDWARYADDTPLKRMTRMMVQMVNTLNKGSFGARRAVTCYTCHRGTTQPKVIPNLAEQYGVPPPNDPNEIEILAQAPATLSADQILDRYIQALGGSERLAALTSFAAQGTYEGFDTELEKVPVDVFAKAPGQRTTIVHTLRGDSTRTFDGRAGWIAGPGKPVPLLTLTGKDLDGLKLDAELSFPAGIKQALGRLRTGFPKAAIGGREVQIIQGTGAGGSRVKLFFEKESGLLVRVVRYTETAVGVVPTQTDYSDYREVAGVKMPFHWTVTWTDGQSTTELSGVQPNVRIDAAKFAKPAPAASKAAAR
jgi:photosynthetic reaction center cytochrome c subunit